MSTPVSQMWAGSPATLVRARVVCVCVCVCVLCVCAVCCACAHVCARLCHVAGFPHVTRFDRCDFSDVVYGPLANGATTLLFESIPTYPDSGRYWEVHKPPRSCVCVCVCLCICKATAANILNGHVIACLCSCVQMVERYGINQLYLAPTAIRRLMKDGQPKSLCPSLYRCTHLPQTPCLFHAS